MWGGGGKSDQIYTKYMFSVAREKGGSVELYLEEGDGCCAGHGMHLRSTI